MIGVRSLKNNKDLTPDGLRGLARRLRRKIADCAESMFCTLAIFILISHWIQLE